MAELQTFMAEHGYTALFVLGFAEFAAIPVATIPVLIAAGAMGAEGAVHPFWAAASVAAGGLVADIAWLSLTRRHGSKLVDVACGLTSRPGSCVLAVTRNVSSFGAPYLVLGKFVPGTAALLAAAAGLAGLSYRRFMVLDAVALLVWASTYTWLGWLFADYVEIALGWVIAHHRAVVGALGLALAAALVARARKVAAHRPRHAAAVDRATGDPGLEGL